MIFGAVGQFALIYLDEVIKAHCHPPRLPVASVEYCGNPVTEMTSIPLGLLHPFSKAKLFASFALDVDAGEAGHIRHFPVAHGLPRLNTLEPVFVEDLHKLQFRPPAFSL